MFTSRCLPLAAAVTALALLAGCANNNPYDTQSQSQGGMSKTAKYGGLGALAGAVAGAAIDHNNRGKGALIGAAVAGARPPRVMATTPTSRKPSCVGRWKAPAWKCSARATTSS